MRSLAHFLSAMDVDIAAADAADDVELRALLCDSLVLPLPIPTALNGVAAAHYNDDDVDDAVAVGGSTYDQLSSIVLTVAAQSLRRSALYSANGGAATRYKRLRGDVKRADGEFDPNGVPLDWPRYPSVLAAGYRLRNENSAMAVAHEMIEQTSINSTHIALTHSHAMRRLLMLTSQRVIAHVLSSTILLVPVTPSSHHYHQLSGPSLAHLPHVDVGVFSPRQLHSHDEAAARKRCKTSETARVIPRSALFYYFNERAVTSGGVAMDHTLNQCNSARAVRFIVQRQILQRTTRTVRLSPPWQSVCGLLKDIVFRHARTDYAQLIGHHDPLPSNMSAMSDAELMQLNSQPNRVQSYVRAVLVSLVPMRLFGSAHNRDHFLRSVNTFITLGRFECFRVDEVVVGIRLSQIQWISCAAPQSHVAARHIVASVYAWIISHIVVPVIRHSYFVTESESSKTLCLFYRSAVWSIIHARTLSSLQRKQFRLIDGRELYERLTAHAPSSTQSIVGVSRLRFRPRASRVRPIMNMSRPAKLALINTNGRAFERMFPPINSQLKPPFECLTFETENRAIVTGFGVSGADDIRTAIGGFLLRRRRSSLQKPLFAAAVDIAACFDHIDRHQLLKLIPHIFTHSHYILHGMSVCRRRRWKFIRCVVPADNGYGSDTARMLSGRRPYCDESQLIVVENAKATAMVEASRLVDMIRSHVNNNIVKVNRQYLHQINGIPQGSNISALLCAIILAHVERTHIIPVLKRFGDDTTLIVRQMDDYLIVSESRHHIDKLISRLSAALSRIGLTINTAKTQYADALSTSNVIRWNGIVLDTKTLDVHSDFARQLASSQHSAVRRLMTVETARRDRDSFERIVTRWTSARAPLILFDATVITRQCAVVNTYQSFRHAANKISEFFEQIDKRFATKLNAEVSADVLTRSIRHFHRALNHRIAAFHRRSNAPPKKADSQLYDDDDDNNDFPQTNSRGHVTFALSVCECDFVALTAFYDTFKHRTQLRSLSDAVRRKRMSAMQTCKRDKSNVNADIAIAQRNSKLLRLKR